MAKKGENIFQRANGRWEGRYPKERVNGRIRYGYVSGGSYEEVLFKKQEAVKKHEELHRREASGAEQLRLCSVADDWIEERRPFYKPATIGKYRNNLNIHILPKFGNRLITEITRDEADIFITSLCAAGGKDGKGLSGNAAKSVASTFKSVMEYGRDRRHVAVADMNGFSIKVQAKPIRVLTVNEQEMLEDYLDENISFGNDLIGMKLTLYTGLRLGELCALKWEDVIFDEQEIYIHSTMERVQTHNKENRTKIVVSLPKSGCSLRRIPLPDNICELLKEMKGQDGTYFLTRCRHSFVQPRTMENHFKAVIRKIGIADASFHALRHTFATRCMELGMDAKTLSEILGHSSVRITLDRYVHPSKEEKQRQMNLLKNLRRGK